MENELKLCPICGKLPSLQSSLKSHKYFCGTHVSCGDWKPNIQEAVWEWNRRVTDGIQSDLYKPKAKTNFETITESLEKLAEYFSHNAPIEDCFHCPADKPGCGSNCKEAWLDYLNSEAKEDE